MIKKLVLCLLLSLILTNSTWAIFEPEDPFWLESIELELSIPPREVTITAENDIGYTEVVIDRWFFNSANSRWFKMVLRRVKQFKNVYESNIRTLIIEGATLVTDTHPQYRQYHFRDIEYFFYHNGNKRFVVRDERTRDRTSFFFKPSENRVQIWGSNARIVIDGLTGYIIIPNGKVYDFNPVEGYESLRNRGNVNDLQFLPQEVWELVQDARNYIGTNHALTVNGKTYNNDCSGFVSALYMKYGIDLKDGIENVTNRSGYNLTAIIFDAQDYNCNLHTNKDPMTGDLIFFSNTYDRNHNNQWDDYLTHIGIVESVDDEGTITFIHHLNADIGVRRDRLNLYHPDDTNYNSVIRMQRANDPIHFRYLTGQLFEGFARVFH